MAEIPTLVKLPDMKHHWWVVYYWIRVDEADDSEVMFLRGVMRDPSEAIRAGEEFDSFCSSYRMVMEEQAKK